MQLHLKLLLDYLAQFEHQGFQFHSLIRLQESSRSDSEYKKVGNLSCISSYSNPLYTRSKGFVSKSFSSSNSKF
ncbi:unnamed protein product [Moneuplotes crassus]|uniref:Uncharacterized protein n=1 Tax=Euplotes crassus TaxID=5936 RepID=A0AAD2CYC7_EUPCR|nr:unnamed protein product [Moneuplotes crassus]